MRPWWPAGKPQVGGETGQVGHEALDRRREAAGVGGGEAVGPAPDHGDGVVARLGAGVVEEGPERGLDLGLVLGGHLGPGRFWPDG